MAPDSAIEEPALTFDLKDPETLKQIYYREDTRKEISVDVMGDPLNIGKVNVLGVATMIRQGVSFITLIDTGETFYYSNGVYVPHGEAVVKTFCQGILEKNCTNHIVSEVQGVIERSSMFDREGSEDSSSWICVDNGLLNINTREFVAHSPSRMFFNRLPVRYDPAATCPNIDKFMAEIHENGTDILAMQEAIGHCLMPDYRVQKGHLLVGSGSNGKSTLFNVIISFLGDRNVSSIALQSLSPGANRFAAGQLRGKFANIYDDISAKEVRDTSIFKIATGGGMMSGETKGKDIFNFRNRAKMFFSCNAVPDTDDDSDAYFRRWNIFRYLKQFEGANKDENLIARLTTPEEMSGLLNRALEGITRLNTQGGFSKNETIAQMRKEYKELSDPVGLFVDERCELRFSDETVRDEHGDTLRDEQGNALFNHAFRIPVAELYRAYEEFCGARSLPKVSTHAFKAGLIKGNPMIRDKGVKIGGKNVKCYIGITLADRVSKFTGAGFSDE
jgi:P4 family phage/plasmid primase-like protien